MNNFKMCDINKNDLEAIAKLFDDYTISRKSKSTENICEILKDSDNSIQIINSVHTSKVKILFLDNLEYLKVVDILNNAFPLNFCYYESLWNDANILYNSLLFFNEPLKSTFNENTWQQSEQLFSSKINVIYNGLYTRDSRYNRYINRILLCSLAIAKIQLPSDNTILLPVIEFSLPVDEDRQNRIIISASKEYDFLFQIQNGRFVSVDRNQCIINLKKSIMNNMYLKLNQIMNLSGITLAEFMEMDSEEIEQFILLSNMVSI